MSGRLIDRELLRMYVMIPDQFRDEELRASTFRASGSGAAVWSGGRAAVFQAHVPGGGRLAVRISITTAADQLRVPYLALARWVEANPMPFLARTEWVDGGLVVDTNEVSLLKMEWVEGTTLDDYVDDCIGAGRDADLLRLAEDWRAAMAAMSSARIAHGDLHAQNILIDHGRVSGRVRFVDYDSLWLPELNELPGEVGHQAYQHPLRRWGEHMDAFGAAVVYLSLRAVAVRPALWKDFHRGDMTLLIEEPDLFGDDERGIWSEMARHPEPFVRDLAAELRRWCDAPAERYSSLEMLLDNLARQGTANRWSPTASPDAAARQVWAGRAAVPPGSARSGPVQPAPVQAEPVQPAPVQSEPGQPGAPPPTAEAPAGRARQTWQAGGAAPAAKPSATTAATPAKPPGSPVSHPTTLEWIVIAVVVVAILVALVR